MKKFDLKELRMQKKQNFRERLDFVRQYAAWLKKTPNKVWSAQHSKFIDS